MSGTVMYQTFFHYLYPYNNMCDYARYSKRTLRLVRN